MKDEGCDESSEGESVPEEVKEQIGRDLQPSDSEDCRHRPGGVNLPAREVYRRPNSPGNPPQWKQDDCYGKGCHAGKAENPSTRTRARAKAAESQFHPEDIGAGTRTGR